MPETLKSAKRAPETDFPHTFTTEERRKGAARTNELRRDRAKSERQRLEELYEKRRNEMVQAVIDAAEDGNVAAFVALHDRIYGTPAKSEPETIELDIGSSESRGVALSDLVTASRNGDEPVSQAPDNTADNA